MRHVFSKKTYIENAKNAILNRVRFHAPVVHSDRIETGVLVRGGINPNLPIFWFDKPLSKPLALAFERALREEKFNLVLTAPPAQNGRKKRLFFRAKKNHLGRMPAKEGRREQKILRILKDAVLFSPENSSKTLVEMINKLNINYPSGSNYNLANRDRYFKIDGQIVNPSYDEFSLRKTDVVDNFLVRYREFLLNGSNFFVKIQNRQTNSRSVVLELNLPLEKGYYFFKRLDRAILVENLMTKQKLYLNFLCRNAKFSFSNVDGLENSVYSCVNARLTLSLRGGEESFVFFNFGSTKFAPKNCAQAEKMAELSRRECFKTFNLRVATKNPRFDQMFNRTLPQRIWVNWLSGQHDEALQQKYLSYKRLFLRGDKTLSLVNFREIGCRELGVFNGRYFKKILVLQGDERFLRVGKTTFFNVDVLSERSLCGTEPIAVCFGQ